MLLVYRYLLRFCKALPERFFPLHVFLGTFINFNIIPLNNEFDQRLVLWSKDILCNLVKLSVELIDDI